MCGINGIYAFHPASGMPDEAELLRTRDAMRRRGPDGEGLWWDASRRCGFGHRRLSIIDLSDRAAQPMIADDGNAVVTFNGEIYNHLELRRQLEDCGARFRTTSDTEVLLHLYVKYGADMVRHLRGMFAFAIWDERKRGLFLARDAYGIKPLYTANDGWTFRFASQVKALLAGNRVSRDPEPAGIVGFHVFGSVPEPFTFFRDIRALPAGHTQWVDSAGPREPVAYENLSAVIAEGAQAASPGDRFGEAVRDAVLASVHAHMVADVEVGIFLSAGIDSGALLGLIRDSGQKHIRAITLAFDEFQGTAEDEAPLARQIADRYGAQHVVRRVNKEEFGKDLPAIFDAMDQPSIDGVNTWFVAKAASEAGLKVALSGLGGDELFAGYPSFVDMPQWRRRFGLPASLPGFGIAVRAVMSRFFPEAMQQKPKAAGLFRYAGSWAGVYLLRRGLFLPEELGNLIDPDIAREGLRRLKPLQRLSTSLQPDPDTAIGRVCALESSHYLRNQLLRDADWAGMAHSLEIRVPFVDIALLKRLAPAIRGMGRGVGKTALARAPSVSLPDEIVMRAKSGFGVPTGAWMAEMMNRTRASSNKKESKGNVSRLWSQAVLAGAMPSVAGLN